MIDSTRLRYFVSVADSSSIRRSATLLHITPAALSRAVKVLEAEVGTTLVARHGRGIVLTDAGRRLATAARPILAQLGGLVDEISTRASADAEGPLRYGSHESFGTYFASVLVRHARAGAAIEHRYLQPGMIERMLVAGDIDVGVSYIPYPSPGATTTVAGHVRMATFGRPGHLEVPSADWRFAAPAGPLIDSPVRTQGLDGWPDDKVPRRVRYRVTHTETALEHCRMGRAVAYFPTFVVELHNRRAAARHRLVELPRPPGLPEHLQPVHVTTREGEEHSWQASVVTRAVESVCG